VFFSVWALLLAPLIVPFAPTLAEWEGTFPLKARLYGDAVAALAMLAIRRQAGLSVAVGLSALLFSVYHFGAFKGTWLPAVNVFLAGTLFCLAFGLTGGLWLPISIHFAWNFLLGPALGLTVSGSSGLGSGWRLLEVAGPELWTGGGFGLEGGLVVTLTTAAGALALTLALVRALARSGRRQVAPPGQA
jgi:hypothetical protein